MRFCRSASRSLPIARKKVLAIEMPTVAPAIDSMRSLWTTPWLEEVHALVCAHVPSRPYDHRLDRDIVTLTALTADSALDRFVT